MQQDQTEAEKRGGDLSRSSTNAFQDRAKGPKTSGVRDKVARRGQGPDAGQGLQAAGTTGRGVQDGNDTGPPETDRPDGLPALLLASDKHLNLSEPSSVHLRNGASSYGVCEALGRGAQSTWHWGHLLVSKAPGRARTGRPAHGSTSTAEAPASDPGTIYVQRSPSQLSSNSLGKPGHGFEEGCWVCTRFPL